MLTKSHFQEFRRCPREFWLQHHKPELFAGELSLHAQHLREQGYEVERYARQLDHFKRLSPDRFHIDFQKEFSTAELYAKSDIVVSDKITGGMHIYEVKSSTKVKPEHIEDLAFQKHAAEACGHFVASTHMVTVNTGYRRNGHIDPNELLKITDVSDQIAKKQAEIAGYIGDAMKCRETEPIPSLLEHCGDKHNCTFIRHHFTDIPEHTVFEIPNLTANKLRDLLTRTIVVIRQVPENFELTDRQRRIVDVACREVPHIEADEIRERLSDLKFPLHFLDYETFSYAVPMFPNTAAYQQVVFQYSLHTLNAPSELPTHRFHVSRNDGRHPCEEIAESLQDALCNDEGTVIVWSEGFEKSVNKKLGEMFPDCAEFFEKLNERVFDLRKIFSDQLYVHPKFRVSTSLKNVLPVLCPHQPSYDSLPIADGTSASINWYHLATRRYSDDRCTEIYNNLCNYCELDTLAMVWIYEMLAGI